MLALGMRPAQIGAMVWLELLAMAGIGCVAGVAIGGGVTLWLQHQGLVIPGVQGITAQFGMPSRLFPQLTLFSASAAPCAILACILIGGIAPYLRVTRLTPAEAVRVSS